MIFNSLLQTHILMSSLHVISLKFLSRTLFSVIKTKEHSRNIGKEAVENLKADLNDVSKTSSDATSYGVLLNHLTYMLN